MKIEELRECLEKDGFTLELVAPATMRSRFRGGDRIFPVFIHLEAEFVTFAVIPFVRLPDDEVQCEELARTLLRHNREMNMAKFSVDEDGDVVLSVEYRVDDLDPSEVRDAVDVLSFYAEKYNGEILALAEYEG